MPKRPSETIAPASALRPVSTTDLLKVAGLLFVLVDHYGLFFDDDQLWWRVFGRVAAPIFFFLIGYAHTRRVPLSWLITGAALTVLDNVASEEDLSETSLNILLSFALLRLVLPFVEDRVMPSPSRLALLVLLTVALIRPVGNVLEYGMEGWIWAYLGLARRLAVEREGGTGGAGDLRTLALGLAAGVIYLLTESHDLDLARAQTIVLAPLLAMLVFALVSFRRIPSPWQPPELLAGPIRFAGRHSFALYAASLVLMQIGGVLQDQLAG